MSSPLSPSSSNQSSVSSTPRTVEEIVTTVRIPVVRPKPAFLAVLKLAGGTGETYIMPEIIDLVRAYIGERKLYDEQDPRIVYCQNDPLGAALNVATFTIEEALKLFWANCYPTPDSCLRIKHQVVSPLPGSSNGAVPVAGSSVTNDASSRLCSSQPSTSTSLKSEDMRLTASQPSTSITQSDLDAYEREQDEHGLSTVIQEPVHRFQDETDGGPSPLSCQVERRNQPPQPRMRNHDSLVVECTSDSFSVEYELVSSSEAEIGPDRVENEESEGSPSSLDRAEVYVVCQESDIEYLADYSDSDSDSDAELSSEDKWQCNQCNFKNCAMYRNCEKCWSIRLDWLPTPSGSGTDKSFNIKDESCQKDNTTPVPKQSSAFRSSPDHVEGASAEIFEKLPSNPIQDLNASSQDSAIGSLASSQEHPKDLSASKETPSLLSESQKLPTKTIDDMKPVLKRLKADMGSDLSDSSSGEKLLKKSKRDAGREMNTKCLDPCVICLTRAKTASIVHRNTGHQVCCYRCAKRLKQQRKPCPICRRPIQKVIRNYF